MFDSTTTGTKSPCQQPQLIDYYKAIEGASRQMLEAAQLEDWDQVVQTGRRMCRFDRAVACRVPQARLATDLPKLKSSGSC
jgi:hypothetical protein